MRDIFSFFEKPKEREGEVVATVVETVTVINAYVQAMGIRIGIRDRDVGATPMSAEQIREASFGEVLTPATFDETTLEPDAGGLFCRKTFGPAKDYECACGKYSRMKHRGVVCEVCEVEVIHSKVRRERFGHILLPGPCLNPLLVGAVATLLEQSEDAVRSGARQAQWDALAALDLESIEAMEAGPRADLAACLVAADVPATALMLETLPVLPPDLRPIVPVREGWAASDVNTHYQEVLRHRAPGPELEQAIERLFINEWADRPLTDDGRTLRSLASLVDGWAQHKLFTKPVDYSGIAHLTVDPTLDEGECRVPRSMLVELYKPRAFGLLESMGYVTTIKSAKRMVEAGKPEAMQAIERASEGAVVLLATEARVIARRVRAWDAPAIAVDESTAQRLDALVVTLHVPLCDEAALQCDALDDHARPGGVAGAGWLSRGGSFVEAVVAAVGSGERDPMDDPLVSMAFGRAPPDPDPDALAQWREREQARQEAIRARDEADLEQAKAEGMGPAGPAGPAGPEDPVLDYSVDELEVSVRLANALQNASIHYVRDICRRTEVEMLETKGFGRKELKELKELLADFGLTLGMQV